MANTPDDKLIAALALAVAQSPRANLQQLARLAGISKATLYRIAPTRADLVAMLLERATRHMRDALAEAGLENTPFPSALARLTENLMSGRSLYLFWNTALWRDLNEAKEDDLQGYRSSFYSVALEEFFLNGQKAGAFRIDMPAKWLAKAYDFLLYAAIESAQSGELAPVGMSTMVDQMFLRGAINGSMALEAGSRA
jgi:TetR/AcrR family transcriptional regulator, mexCD-oprJ operon repressor